MEFPLSRDKEADISSVSPSSERIIFDAVKTQYGEYKMLSVPVSLEAIHISACVSIITKGD